MLFNIACEFFSRTIPPLFPISPFVAVGLFLRKILAFPHSTMAAPSTPLLWIRSVINPNPAVPPENPYRSSCWTHPISNPFRVRPLSWASSSWSSLFFANQTLDRSAVAHDFLTPLTVHGVFSFFPHWTSYLDLRSCRVSLKLAFTFSPFISAQIPPFHVSPRPSSQLRGFNYLGPIVMISFPC